MIKCWQIPDCRPGGWDLGLQNMEDVVPEIEGNKVPWRELVEVLVSALLGLYPGVMGVR